MDHDSVANQHETSELPREKTGILGNGAGYGTIEGFSCLCFGIVMRTLLSPSRP